MSAPIVTSHLLRLDISLYISGQFRAQPMDDTSAQIFFPWKCLWKTLNFVYFFHGIPGPFLNNFAWNSSVFHRGKRYGQKMEWPNKVMFHVV